MIFFSIEKHSGIVRDEIIPFRLLRHIIPIHIRSQCTEINPFQLLCKDMECGLKRPVGEHDFKLFVQNNDTLMSEKIQSTLVNSLPLWKSQMLLALGLAHSQEAAKAQQMVTDATNEMLVQNAETLHDATVTSAKEYERGIVDMETLKKTQASLISTIDEVIKIQDDGRSKRREA